MRRTGGSDDAHRPSRDQDDTYGRLRAGCTMRIGTLEDVDLIYQLGIREVGVGYHVAPGHIRELMAASGDVLRVVERAADGRAHALAGYFVLYPLTGAACERIRSGAITTGFGVTPEHLCADFGDAEAIYIAQLTGERSLLDRTGLLTCLHEVIATTLRERGRLRYLFSRPGTQDGARWMSILRFAPIRVNGSQIWQLGPREVNRFFAQDAALAQALRGARR
jgi:hypothetical protein